jgi:uncharacterized membrane protein
MNASRKHEHVSREWAVAAVAAVGLAISAYLASTKLAGGGLVLCEAGGGCDIVQSSRYAVFLGAPTAAWGAALYALITGLALAGLTVRRWLAVFALATAAVAFSGYLTYLQLFVVRAVCPWCLADAGVAVALAGTVLVRRPEARRRQTRPGRLALIAGGVAVATVVFAAGVYVADAPSERPAYREALARHLEATGAVFYGAYW